MHLIIPDRLPNDVAQNDRILCSAYIMAYRRDIDTIDNAKRDTKINRTFVNLSLLNLEKESIIKW